MSEPLSPAQRRDLMDGLVSAALEAGAAIMAVRSRGFEVVSKSDASPVTAADHAAEAVILEALRRLAPGVPVVAEEECAAGRIPEVATRFFLVDPLDGTKEFVRGGTDFTVNIGLVEGGAPTLGVVFAPARDELYIGDLTTSSAEFAAAGRRRGLYGRSPCVRRIARQSLWPPVRTTRPRRRPTCAG